MTERVADYIIRKVNEAGASHIFLVSGRGILYLTDAVAKNKNIVPVPTFHEQGASYAAMAYASAKGSVSACLVSTGCAAANAVTAALCAYQDSLPVVFISGNNPLKENTRHTGAEIRTYGSQEADIIRIVESVTKYAVMLDTPERVIYETEKALYLAQEGRKGPVWIDVPLDVQNMRIEEDVQKHYVPERIIFPGIREAVADVSEELRHAERPVLLVGGGAAGAADEIKALAEEYRLPVVFSPKASDIYGTANPFSIGAVGSIGGSRAGNFTVQNSDYLLVAGCRLCSQLTGEKTNFAREAKITVVDIDANENREDGVQISRFINCDAKEFLRSLLKTGLPACKKEWSEKCNRWKSVFAVSREAFVRELREADQIDLYSLVDELNDILPSAATVITDAGFEELAVPSSLQLREGQRCLFPAAQGAMGYAIPAILGAYEAGRRDICCIVGDGSIMMNIQELQVIASHRIPVKILVISNNMYAVIRKRQRDLFRSRTIGTDPGDGVPQPDFKKIAECFGFGYRRLENRSEFLAALPGMLEGEAEIIEIICTPEQKYFHESFAFDENHKLVRRPIEDMAPFLPRNLVREEMVIGMKEG